MKRAVEIAAGDRCVLRGEIHEGGTSWVVMAHGSGEDLDVWSPTARRLASDGFTVLPFDLRGHGGSDGEPDACRNTSDLLTVCAFAELSGAGRVFVVAAGSSTPSAAAAAERGSCSAVVLVGPSADPHAEAGCPRLIIARSADDQEQATARALSKGRGAAVVVHIPVHRNHSLLTGDWAANVSEFTALYLRDRRAAIQLTARASAAGAGGSGGA